MKLTTMTNTSEMIDLMSAQLLMYLEMGNLSGERGNEQESIDYYIKGLQIAREIGDQPRIRQFSNLILTYI